MNLSMLNWSGWLLLTVWLLFALSYVGDCCCKHADGKTIVGLVVLTPWLLWLVTP